MNKLIPTVAVLALSMLPATPPLQAATGIQRCAMPDGSIGYTDAPCGAVGASAIPIPADMMNRLVATVPPEARDAALPATGHATRIPARRSSAAGCARSPAQLEADLVAAFALRDANRIAESYHWVGMSNAQGQQVMDRLHGLGQRPLDDAHYFDARIGSLAVGDTIASSDPDWRPAPAATTGGAGLLQLRFGGTAPLLVDLKVEAFSGCYFVRL